MQSQPSSIVVVTSPPARAFVDGLIAARRMACAVEMTMECLPGSTLSEELRKHGYNVTETGEGERILPGAIIEKLVVGADGALEPLTTGSTGRSR
jgi:hypothetical protein